MTYSAQFEAAIRAITSATRDLPGWPDPAAIRAIAGVGAPSDERLGLDAWLVVRRAMSSVGRYQTVDFGPTVNKAVEALGGWVDLCLRDETDLESFARPQFLRAVAAMKQPGDDAPMFLRGEHDRQNALTGYPPGEIAALPCPGLPQPAASALRIEHTPMPRLPPPDRSVGYPRPNGRTSDSA